MNHIAFLVRSVDAASAVARAAGLEVGAREDFEGEGTAEVYVGGPGDSARLLLMESIGPGPYRRALEKRGPGLHHIAIDVADVESFVGDLGGSGWLLHPRSLRTLKATRTAWLARPGARALIEVQERAPVSAGPACVTQVTLPLSPQEKGMMAALGLVGVVTNGESPSITAGGRRIPIADLVGGGG
ncbi:MAG: hypothetical protein KF878_29390 [Planctomycetes bacterium]|nr:hypothetical protein [Planctomycetota bacterium]